MSYFTKLRHLASRRLTVLIYHRVLANANDSLFEIPSAEQFEHQLRSIGQFARFLSLPQAMALMAQNALPKNATIVTFDDGYLDNLTVAAPILKKLNIPATFFITTNYMDGGMMFNDRVAEAVAASSQAKLIFDHPDLLIFDGIEVSNDRGQRAYLADQLIKSVKHLAFEQRELAVQAIERASGQKQNPKPLMMNPEQVLALSQQGMEIGAHTCAHPILSRLSEEEASEEILASRRRLQNLLQKDIPYFAYPNGVPGQDYGAREIQLVKEAGFSHAFSTRQGACDQHSDHYQLPRFTPWSPHPLKMRLQWWRNLSQ